jgi:hypothetical protein
MLNKKALIGTASAPPVFVEDVFSTWIYAGNGSSQTITNGIDLAGKGGLTWIKGRSAGAENILTDTVRGRGTSASNNKALSSNMTNAENLGGSYDFVSSFNANGFAVTSGGGSVATRGTNQSGVNYCSWTFREQAKFFDIVTWSGNSTNRTISHNLGSVPGMIIVKRTDASDAWFVYHRSLPASNYLTLSSTDEALVQNVVWNSTAPTSSVFTVGTDPGVNASGGTYVAYLFAHDAGGFGTAGTDNVISCGSYTGTGSGAGNNITLGFEPQFIFVKNTSASTDWCIIDAIRGTGNSGLGAAQLYPNTSSTETGTDGCWFTPTGFTLTAINTEWNASGNTYIYMAIRRPMKVPTTGTSVFQPIAYTGTNADNRLVDTGIVTDMVMARRRANASTGGFYTADRLRGNASLGTASTATENTDADSFMTPTAGYGNSFSAMNGFGVGNDTTRNLNGSSTTQLAYAFQRRPGFFDAVCYTQVGTSGTQTINHNLTVAPELVILKTRSAVNSWFVRAASYSGGGILNSTDAFTGDIYANSLTSTTFGFDLGTAGEGDGAPWVAYLFATLAGVSKVGSYTGNGSSQTINCGFAAGARFVMIKRTDSTSDWCVFDTARGIVSANDPILLMNSTTSEVTSVDYLDPDNTGFIVIQETSKDLNVNSSSYIYLAIA